MSFYLRADQKLLYDQGFDQGYAAGYQTGYAEGYANGEEDTEARMTQSARKTPSTIEDLEAFWYDK